MPDITTRPSERHKTSPEVSAAFHESGHAVAIVWAFRAAAWLPNPPPPLPVRFIEITDSAAGWSGSCTGANIYTTGLSLKRVGQRYRDLMERQVVIHLAGGLAESIHRGEGRREQVLAFAESNCCIDIDLERARAVRADLFRLTGVHHDAQPFTERALALLTTNWRAVEALADELIENRRVEGARVVRIIDRAS